MGRGFRWYELLPEIVVAVGLGVFLIDQTDAATSAFESSRAITLMVVVAIGWLVARVVLARVLARPLARTGLFAVAGLAILGVVVIPAYDDDTVTETFPVASRATTTQPPDTRPDDSAPPTSASEPAPEPVRVRVGSFRGIDHRARGTVALYRQPDGRHVVGLEDFDIQPGPDYDLYVVPGRNREDKDDGTRLDDLRGNRGTQFYDVPANLDLEDGTWTVLVWCQTFAVPIANATPA